MNTYLSFGVSLPSNSAVFLRKSRVESHPEEVITGREQEE